MLLWYTRPQVCSTSHTSTQVPGYIGGYQTVCFFFFWCDTSSDFSGVKTIHIYLDFLPLCVHILLVKTLWLTPLTKDNFIYSGWVHRHDNRCYPGDLHHGSCRDRKHDLWFGRSGTSRSGRHSSRAACVHLNWGNWEASATHLKIATKIGVGFKATSISMLTI